MPLTDEQLERRRQHIGASDMAMILGVHPQKNAFDLWLDKTDKLEPESTASESAEIGMEFEAAVLTLAERRLGPLVRGEYFEHEGTALAANLDARLKGGDHAPVEAKTSGLAGPVYGKWGDYGSADVPEHILVQVHVQALCMPELPARAHVAAVLGGIGLRLYQIRFNERLAQIIIAEAQRFWDEHVLKDEPPADLAPSLEIVHRIRRQGAVIRDIDPKIVSAWLEKREARLAAAEEEKEAKARTIAALGDAEAANCGELGAVTYYEYHKDGYTVQPFDHRTLYHRKNPL